MPIWPLDIEDRIYDSDSTEPINNKEENTEKEAS